MHSVGTPLAPGPEPTCRGRATPRSKYIVHFPEERAIWSYGSGYGGNALLGKKCLALRIASTMARDEGWLAEHMLILGVDRPGGREDLRRRRVPQRLRQDQLRDAHPAAGVHRRGLEGHDRRRRHRLDQARPGRQALRDQSGGRLLRRRSRHVIRTTNPNAMETIRPNTIFTNVALTDDGDVWWEGMDGDPPAHAIDWQGNDWTPGLGHARPRIRTPASPRPATQCPSLDPRLGRSRTACRSGRSSSAAAAPGTIPLVVAGVQLDVRRLHAPRPWARRRPPPRSASRARCAATRSRCCRSAATTWATTSTTGSRSDATSPTRRASST